MSESERRRGYAYSRVLIDSDRLLDPQFDSVTLTATGAQVEMLRNMVHYLNRIGTYVAEYQPGYYLTPTVVDYDAIQAMVADLQNKLMNGGGQVFEYSDRYTAWLSTTMTGDEDFEAETDPVVADKVLIVEHIFCQNGSGHRGDMKMMVNNGTNEYALRTFPLPVQYSVSEWSGRITLKEGDYVMIWQGGCLTGDLMEAGVWGYLVDI